MSDEYESESEGFDNDDGGIEVIIDSTTSIPELIEEFNYIGKPGKEVLGKYYSEKDHEYLLNQNMSQFSKLPIPVIEMVLKQAKAKRKAIENRILDVMFQQGATKLTFPNGDVYKKEAEYTVKVLDKSAFFVYLKDVGYDHIIKTVFKFDNSVEREQIKAFDNWLIENRVVAEKEEAVNGMTQKATIKKIIEGGKQWPSDTVAEIQTQNVLKVTIKK
jgi:hypothetical protein